MDMLGKIESAQKIVIVGMGLTGLSCVEFLHRPTRKLDVMDTRAQPPGVDELRKRFADVGVHTGGLQTELLLGADLVVVSPGIDLRDNAFTQLRQAGIPIIGDVEIFANYATAPVIGITGSNGKSTVTTLIGDIARAAGCEVAVGGNIGAPVLSLLQQPADVYVLELSSFQLESVYTLNCEVAVMLNISADHMDRYDSFADYVEAKRRIFSGARHCVVNVDDAVVMSATRDCSSVTGFSAVSSNDDVYGLELVAGTATVRQGGATLLTLDQMQVAGSHNLINAAAATAVARLMGWPMSAVSTALAAFSGLPHRCQQVAECDGRVWINDSKGTNVGATVAALDGMHAPIVLIAGGDGKGADFSPLLEAARNKVVLAILIGKDAQKIAAILEGAVAYQFADDMSAAVALAAQHAPAKAVVLLSPACASLDMYQNFEQRGDAFVRAVREQCS